MRLRFLFITLLCAAGCSGGNDADGDSDLGSNTSFDTDPEPSTSLDPTAASSLMTADGTEIPSKSLSCIYRQSTGADDALSLQLQYTDAPGSVAFAAYLEDPIPAEPFAVSAGQQGRFDFEVFLAGVGYGSELSGGEVEVRLDSLPSPAALTDGDRVVLQGSLLINQFSLPEKAAVGETATGVLDLASGSVDIDCETTYQSVEVLN